MNLMTEEEARARWCPFARVPLYAAQPVQEESPTAANRAPPGANDATRAGVERETRCLGAGCMAWRWAPAPLFVKARDAFTEAQTEGLRIMELRDGPGVMLGVPADDPVLLAEPQRGSCGLAGRGA